MKIATEIKINCLNSSLLFNSEPYCGVELHSWKVKCLGNIFCWDKPFYELEIDKNTYEAESSLILGPCSDNFNICR